MPKLMPYVIPLPSDSGEGSQECLIIHPSVEHDEESWAQTKETIKWFLISLLDGKKSYTAEDIDRTELIIEWNVMIARAQMVSVPEMAESH